jgi:hypothetical protein
MLPETVTINQIKYGTQLRSDACLADGGRLRLDPEELKVDRLVPLLEKLPQISHLNIEAPVEWLRVCVLLIPQESVIFSSSLIVKYMLTSAKPMQCFCRVGALSTS